ncbi:MAG TPA: nucleoside 2-deoxyribosyltransferase [Erysipelothrix sp.]|nr:nucleoside 2-deoxyribosyltransferase [Erysipelothrix sp.]
MKQIYFASPLFSKMELEYNAKIVKRIRETYPDVTVFLPQEQGEINNKSNYADSMTIAKVDTEAVLNSDLLIAVLDGISIDPGVASEIGVAYAKNIPCLGLFTDSRVQGFDNHQKLEALRDIGESQFPYVNLYTVGLIKLNGEVVGSEDDLITNIANYLG